MLIVSVLNLYAKSAIMKKIGILGSGIVARVLGDGFLKSGHEIML